MILGAIDDLQALGLQPGTVCRLVLLALLLQDLEHRILEHRWLPFSQRRLKIQAGEMATPQMLGEIRGGKQALPVVHANAPPFADDVASRSGVNAVQEKERSARRFPGDRETRKPFLDDGLSRNPPTKGLAPTESALRCQRRS